ncbi:MAG: uracil-DNA glycosylase family protein [Candidatus Marinimicrobia bacterium]|nr:uracil-DNA glycosylase family protein [Candidatus Neomarinimicrobiota bacterium]
MSDRNYVNFEKEVRACRECRGRYFDHDPRPVFQASLDARVLIMGQAPSRSVHETGLPWNDVSGDNLRAWMGVTRDQFYDPGIFAIVPAALCFPGTVRGKGDLPPPPICAPKWHPRFEKYIKPELKLLIGRYALDYYLDSDGPVSAIVGQWQFHLKQGIFPLPHPSPRNRKWIKDRPWFEAECLAELKRQLKPFLAE